MSQIRGIEMLLLLFSVGRDSYAIESSRVVEVIPSVPLRKLHHVPQYVAGLLNYRGTIAPVVDLSHLIQGVSSRFQLSTRIMIVKSSEETAMPYLGLLAEQVIQTLDKSKAEFVNSKTVHMNAAPYLGGMILDERGMIQQIHVDRLFADVQQIYFAAREAQLQ
ncbi:chemotaxis protein CheW [Leptolyngbya sp. AN03gr2]|uniref:chemotaxis protein CheW n=1 Tax=unclassified Leptolyngbya TaxID=2650499 RepID=UPI003D318BEB